jgi:2-methylisocitrate lyase-like PEP mutase family enzyme
MSGAAQAERAIAFRALHQRAGAFVIPNPWDAGSAVLFEQLGFEALATTSAGLAFTRARADGAVTRDEVLGHVAELVAVTTLPISVDLENGYGDAPEDAAATIRMAADVGAVGGSIEDATGDSSRPIYDFELAAERVRAAAEAAHALPIPFTFTARCENFLHGRTDLADTVRRLQAYEAAGADVLYAPGVPEEELTELLRSVGKPVNALAGAGSSVEGLATMGVRRISLGSGLARAAFGGAMRAAEEIRERGTFGFLRGAASYAEMNGTFARRK